MIRSARRAYIIGVTVGQTNVFFFDSEGRQITGLDIAVTRDLNGVRGALKQSLPDADLRVEGVGDGVMLSGSVASPSEAQQAYDIAARLIGDGAKVVNGIVVRGRDQVMLRSRSRKCSAMSSSSLESTSAAASATAPPR